MTPFVDVVLVLLVIFMLTAPLTQQGFNVQLPKTQNSGLSVPENPLILTIKKNGSLYLADTRFSMKRLPSKIRAIAKARKDKSIYIQADRRVSYGPCSTSYGTGKVSGSLQYRTYNNCKVKDKDFVYWLKVSLGVHIAALILFSLETSLHKDIPKSLRVDIIDLPDKIKQINKRSEKKSKKPSPKKPKQDKKTLSLKQNKTKQKESKKLAEPEKPQEPIRTVFKGNLLAEGQGLEGLQPPFHGKVLRSCGRGR